MTERLTTPGVRLKVDTLQYIEKMSTEGITVDRKERALRLYLSGKLSLEGAARFAGLYIGDFLDLMQDRGIESQVTLDMVKKGRDNLESA